MSELTTTARPYARAIFDLAKKAGTLSEWSDMLQLLAAAVSHEDAHRVLDNPKLSKEQAADLLIQICGDKLDDNGKNLAKLLAENSRLAALPEISVLFEEQKAEEEGNREVEVTSAYPLSDEDQAKLTKALKKKFGRDVSLSVEIDESILGGVIIRSGDTVIDGSIQGRLQQMTQTLNG